MTLHGDSHNSANLNLNPYFSAGSEQGLVLVGVKEELGPRAHMHLIQRGCWQRERLRLLMPRTASRYAPKPHPFTQNPNGFPWENMGTLFVAS